VYYRISCSWMYVRFNQFLLSRRTIVISALSINIPKYVKAKNTILNESIRRKLKCVFKNIY